MWKFHKNSHKSLVSFVIITASLGLAYAPLPSLKKTIIVVSGTELQEPLKALSELFETENSSIKIELKFQGSQDIVNNFIQQKNDLKPTILILC